MLRYFDNTQPPEKLISTPWHLAWGLASATWGTNTGWNKRILVLPSFSPPWGLLSNCSCPLCEPGVAEYSGSWVLARSPQEALCIPTEAEKLGAGKVI